MEHQGLPDPFFDDNGFPLCLRRIRDEVTRLGGVITGAGLHWVIAHPYLSIPPITAQFDTDGEAIIRCGHLTWVEAHCSSQWWNQREIGTGYTWPESIIHGFVTGDCETKMWVDDEQQAQSHTYVSGDLSAFRTPPDDPSRIAEWRYPVWPVPGDP